ncbi:MAG: aromatic acid decarboxylase [Phycisphaerae bacterium]|nr:aromatic acid decarboxylase [Phycisphaerae bacterium]MDG1899753.1 UbiX family flavin prenyltransferase [Phycisphaerales bacterium]|tara:strand:+ start:2942 stop:3538 length:597 start_codon:yes stop_codon:yes gene_type:complete
MRHNRIVVGITGASGAPYALRLIRRLTEAGIETHVTISTLGKRLLFDESDIKRCEPENLVDGGDASLVIVHNDNDLGSTIASGSFLHDGMVIVPCSSNTMASLAAGITTSLVHRAAAVTLKEGRKLVVAHRETPLGRIELMNMERLVEAGAVIAPLSPGFYLRPRTVDDILDFMVGRLMDLLGVEHDLATRWDPSTAH